MFEFFEALPPEGKSLPGVCLSRQVPGRVQRVVDTLALISESDRTRIFALVGQSDEAQVSVVGALEAVAHRTLSAHRMPSAH